MKKQMIIETEIVFIQNWIEISLKFEIFTLEMTYKVRKKY